MQYLPRCLPLIFVTLLAGLLTVPAAAQQNTTIAVVDVERLFSESAAGKALGEQLDGVRTEVQGRINALQREVQEIRAQLQQLAPDSERALDLQRQGVVKEGQLQAELQFGQARVNNLMLQSNLLVLNLTKQAVAGVGDSAVIYFKPKGRDPAGLLVAHAGTRTLTVAVKMDAGQPSDSPRPVAAELAKVALARLK